MPGSRHLAQAVLGLLMAAAVCVPTAADDAARVMTWTINNAPRRAIVYSPTVPSPGRKALVLSFHGRGDNITNFQRTDMQRAWPEAVVVYFQGLPGASDRLTGWQTRKGQDGDRDLTLVDAALATLRTEFKIDERRIYATGFSNGAMFTYLLWAERPDVFAAYAPVAGRISESALPNVPKPLFHVAGVRDERIPITAQEEAIAYARRVNQAADAGVFCGDGCTLYGQGSSAPVMAWLHSGGHEYPEATSKMIAAFFREHVLNR